MVTGAERTTEQDLFRMAAARMALCVFVFTLAAATLTEGLRGSGPRKCCFRFNENPVPRTRVVSYVKTSQLCPNPAVLLRTVTGRQMCVRQSDTWVKDLITDLDTRIIAGETSNL